MVVDLDRLEQVALEAHKNGGRVLRRYFRRLAVVGHKGGDYANLLTVADEKSEEVILATIRGHFPDHVILAEESGESGAEDGAAATRWFVDPLDGTTNYSHGLPYYSISIAVEHEGEVVFGSVSNPQWRELFVARRGGGAFRNGRPIHVSSNDSLRNSLVVTGLPYDRRERADRYGAYWKGVILRSQGLRRMGSAAIDMCYVAAGIFDAYYEESLNPWDWAAGELMVREAGGRVTDFAGRPFEVDFKQCLASNGRVHDEMLKILANAPFGRVQDSE